VTATIHIEAEPSRPAHIAPDGMGLTHQSLAEALAEPGFTIADAKAFVRNAHAAGAVKHYSRARADGRESYFYRADAALAAAVIYRASEAGFASPEARRAIGEAIQRAFTDAELPGGMRRDEAPRSPGIWVLAMCSMGQKNFALDLAFFKKHGERRPVVAARIRQEVQGQSVGTSFPDATEDLELRSSWTCHLDPVITHLTRPKAKVH
jgi:hypothetical protein